MTLADLHRVGEALLWVILAYAVVVTLSYLLVNLVSVRAVTRYMQLRSASAREYFVKGDEPPISILVPAYNEQEGIVASVRSLLQLHYACFEIIVINDGSKDETLARMLSAFEMEPFPPSYAQQLPSQTIRGVYASTRYPNLRLIDKENGGKSDSLNAGINLSEFGLFCCVDADSILERDSLLCIVRPFIENPHCIACGGVIRLVNGCAVEDGHILERRLPQHPLALFQAVEYLRGILLARVGWSEINGLLVISGAFGLFHKQTVVDCGGYAVKTIGEDMELTVRMHRLLRAKKQPYHVAFVPDPVCWTEAPETLAVLRSQRIRWHLGLSESLWLNRDLMFARGSGVTGWLSMPFWTLIEWMAPLVEFGGYVLLVVSLLLGAVNLTLFVLFTLTALNLGLLLSTIALLADALSFQILARPRDVLKLFAYAILENFGYRQLTVWWRVVAIYRWVSGKKVAWGTMTRKTDWQKTA